MEAPPGGSALGTSLINRKTPVTATATEGEAGEQHSHWGSLRTRGCQMRFQGFQMSFSAFPTVKLHHRRRGKQKTVPIIPQSRQPRRHLGLALGLLVCSLTR